MTLYKIKDSTDRVNKNLAQVLFLNFESSRVED